MDYPSQDLSVSERIWAMIPSARGSTLIEVLAAVTLTSLLIVAAYGWATIHAAYAQRAAVSAAARWDVQTVGSLLDDDLRCAANPPGQSAIRWMAPDRLEIDSLHAAPGDQPGWKTTVWWFDRHSGTLFRERHGAQRRPLASGWEDIAFTLDATRHLGLSMRRPGWTGTLVVRGTASP